MSKRPPMLSDANLGAFSEFGRAGAGMVRASYEGFIERGELIPKSEVEAMLSDALGVSKETVWAELGTKRGFGTRIE